MTFLNQNIRFGIEQSHPLHVSHGALMFCDKCWLLPMWPEHFSSRTLCAKKELQSQTDISDPPFLCTV